MTNITSTDSVTVSVCSVTVKGAFPRPPNKFPTNENYVSIRQLHEPCNDVQLIIATMRTLQERAIKFARRQWEKKNLCSVATARRVALQTHPNRPFAASDHVVQNQPCWRASSLLFPHWDIKTKASQASLVQVSLF